MALHCLYEDIKLNVLLGTAQVCNKALHSLQKSSRYSPSKSRIPFRTSRATPKIEPGIPPKRGLHSDQKSLTFHLKEPYILPYRGLHLPP